MTYQLLGAALPIDPRLVEALDGEWRRFAWPGTWWTGAERIAIASEARVARSCALCAERLAALSPEVGEEHAAGGPLTAGAVDAVHRIARDPGRLSSRWFRQVMDSGVSPEQLVEMTGVIAILTIGDTLARACGAAPSELPAPEAGEPSRQRPPGLETESAWVPMVHPDRAEGPIRGMYDSYLRAAGYVYNVGRALTLVPAEVAGFGAAFYPTYNVDQAPSGDALSRPQMELLASSVSAANDCFY